MAEWLVYVADEYDLQGRRGHEGQIGHAGRGARRDADRLVRAFTRITGRRLALMTLTDFVQLEPRHGRLLFTVFHGILDAGRLGGQASGFPLAPRPLTPIGEALDSPASSPRAGVQRAVPQPQDPQLFPRPEPASHDRYDQASRTESRKEC